MNVFSLKIEIIASGMNANALNPIEHLIYGLRGDMLPVLSLIKEKDDKTRNPFGGCTDVGELNVRCEKESNDMENNKCGRS